MAVQTIIPQSNVLAVDIRDTLNDNGSSCTNDLLSFFDSRAVINIWSFRKPYATDVDMFKLTDQQIKDINCGFDLTKAQIASYTSLADPNVMDGDMNGWRYVRPSEMSKPMYRLGDYVGYFAGALPMIRDFQVPSQISTQQTTDVAMTAVVQLPETSNKKSVSIADIRGLEGCKAAVYMKMDNSSQERNIVGSSISEGTFNVIVKISEFLQGTWRVYPYLTTGSTHYTIPQMNYKSVIVIASYITASMTAERATDGSRTIYYDIRIKNTSGSDVTINDNYVYIGYKEGTPIKGGQITDGLVAKANTTTTVYSGSFSNIDDMLWVNPIIWCTLNSGNYTARVNVLTERPE